MLEPVRAVLQRELASLLAADEDEDLLFGVGPFLSALESERRLAGAFEDLLNEADDLGRRLRDVEADRNDAELLAHAWENLGDLLREPQLREHRQRAPAFQRLLLQEDHPAVVALYGEGSSGDSSRIGGMLLLIRELDVSGGHAIVDGHRIATDRIFEQRRQQHSRLLRLTHAHPAVGLLRLRLVAAMAADDVVEEVPSLPRTHGDPPALVVRADAHGSHWQGVMDAIVQGRGLEQYGDSAGLARSIRRSARRLVDELRARAASTRSRLALIDRYKVRCEWHDRRRMWDLAEAAHGKRESALRDDLARYLFDAGLDPLSEARLGTTRADIFAGAPAATFLLEAKQYTSGVGIRSALRQAFRQALDTAGRIAGTSYGVDEAFIVLYRRGGPRAILPAEAIVADGLRWYIRLIDIAAPDVSGSRNAEDPVEWSIPALRALLLDVAQEPDRRQLGGRS